MPQRTLDIEYLRFGWMQLDKTQPMLSDSADNMP